MKKIYVQYGCGLSAPKEWINFDASPTLRIQKTPIIGFLLKKQLNVIFSDNVLYGDIIKGLPIKENSCDGIYCSHTLEHLSLNDFRKALKNTYLYLKPGGIFRCIVPDLELAARTYIKNLNAGNHTASITFISQILLGIEERPKGLKDLLASLWGNSHHLWMWDVYSLTEELRKAGFINIRPCSFNDSKDEMFQYVEDQGRFFESIAIECKK